MRAGVVTVLALLVADAACREIGNDVGVTTARHKYRRSGPTSAEPDDNDDEENDSAPFLIVVEHQVPSRWHCAGSLVSQRTGVTSAGCARGRGAGPRHPLYALAAAVAAGQASRAAGARRVARLATAGAPGAAAIGLDMAVLELESPFDPAVFARPILMATAARECEALGTACHVARALVPRQPGRPARLRIVDAVMAPEAACSALTTFWAAVREQAFCMTGPTLCAADWGAGVVCGGKLCGVVSRSAALGAGEDCGQTHAAQSVARWRRFLQCAHTLRACGRGDCAELCTEQRLLEDTPTTARPANDTNVRPTSPRGIVKLSTTGAQADDSEEEPGATPTPKPPTRTRTRGMVAATMMGAAARLAMPPMPAHGVPHALSPRPAYQFEPNRPDFRAGEYGDNAADYIAPNDDAPAPTRSVPSGYHPARTTTAPDAEGKPSRPRGIGGVDSFRAQMGFPEGFAEAAGTDRYSSPPMDPEDLRRTPTALPAIKRPRGGRPRSSALRPSQAFPVVMFLYMYYFIHLINW